jgi:hypothetical protein
MVWQAINQVALEMGNPQESLMPDSVSRWQCGLKEHR